jgi:3-oxoacyl-[acyl-carrier protein] reductase
VNLNIYGRVAVVTAASRGLGFSCAKHLVAEGANVVICARNHESLTEAKRELTALGPGQVKAVPANIHSSSGRTLLFKRARKAFGAIDILIVNTPGGVTGLRSVADNEKKDWDLAIKAKFLTAVELCRTVLPEMRERGWGRIVNLNTITALEPPVDFALSNATRLAALGLFRTLALETAAEGIVVNSVVVGHTNTKALEGYIAQLAEKRKTTKTKMEREILSQTPIRRLLTPDETGALVAFLCSDRVTGIIGQTIRVDGGFSRSL